MKSWKLNRLTVGLLTPNIGGSLPGVWYSPHSHRPRPHLTDSHAEKHMRPSFCPQKLPEREPLNFPTPPASATVPAAARGGGGGRRRKGREPSEIRCARLSSCRTAACVVARGTSASVNQCETRFYGVTERSHLTRTFPCILAVSIRLFSFILPPPSSRSATERFKLGEFAFGALLSALPTRHFPASQPASPPGSESARKWVGLQPSVGY